MIVFMLDSMAKKYRLPEKRVIIILGLSRLTLLNNKKRHKQISYLNGFKQIFIENLSIENIEIDSLPDNGKEFLAKNPNVFNFDEVIGRLFGEVIKRFNFIARDP
jgi:hypothetical protein